MIASTSVTVMVDDLDRAVDFYVSVLGLRLAGRDGGFHASVDATGVAISLHPRREAMPAGPGNLSIGFLVDHLDEAVGELAARSVSFSRQENDVNRFAFFVDPDGTPLYLYEPVHAAPSPAT